MLELGLTVFKIMLPVFRDIVAKHQKATGATGLPTDKEMIARYKEHLRDSLAKDEAALANIRY